MAESIFTSQTPANGDFLEGVPVTLGTLFTAAVNGTIDGGRWRFPGTLPVGTTQWLLYQWNSDASGTLLAQENFVAPVAGAWNTVNATTPVSITAGQRYVTAVFTPNGRYVLTQGFFSGSGVTNGNLTAPQDDAGTPARNGKFTQQGFPSYPTSNFNATCYFVDVIFTAASAATGIPIGLATETDVAFPITVTAGGLAVPVGMAQETDTALPVTPLAGPVDVSLGRAEETDLAFPIVPSMGAVGIPVGRAEETDTASPIVPSVGAVSIPVGRATETDVAFPIAASFDQSIPIGRAEETDTARPVGVRVVDRNPFFSGPCEDWEPLWCEPLSAAAVAVTGEAVGWATEVLWALSGQRFGTCDVTLRPCRDSCAEGYGTWDDWGGKYNPGGSFTGGPRPWWWNGVWANVCASCTGVCSCTALDRARLPAPAREVVEVKLDGLVMNPSAYRLDENRYLVRTDGGLWPVCQSMNLADDRPGTWSVRVRVGEDVPMIGRRAVAQLAAEFAKDCAGEECQVPFDVVSLSRQGVTLDFGNPEAQQVDYMVRLLGLRMVRLFLASYNPEKLTGRGKAYDVDRMPNPWKRVNTS